MSKSKIIRFCAALALVFAALFGEPIIGALKQWNANSVPQVNVVEPSDEYKEVVKDIVNLDIKAEDATQISDFFLTLSDVVINDPGFIETTAHFREFNLTAGGLNFAGLKLKGKYPTLGKEIDEAIMDSVGKESVSFSKEKREKLTQCLNAIAWGVHQ